MISALISTVRTRFTELVGEPGPLTGREAATRFFGVAILIAVGYLHLMDVSHKIEEGVWYMALLFLSLILLSAVLSVALVRADDSRVRFVWVAAAGLAAGAMLGYFVSRAVPLPGMADHQGDWFGTIGVFAWLFELGLVGLSAFALRDRVLRGRATRARVRRRTRVAVPALGILGLVATQPAAALAHGGEEMTPEEMAATEAAQDSGEVDHAAMGHGTSEHDPLLGGTELTFFLMLSLGLLAWAAAALRARVVPAGGLNRSVSRGAAGA